MRSKDASISVRISLGLIVISIMMGVIFPESIDICFPIMVLSVIWLAILIYIFAEDEAKSDYDYEVRKQRIDKLLKESDEQVRKLEEMIRKYE